MGLLAVRFGNRISETRKMPRDHVDCRVDRAFGLVHRVQPSSLSLGIQPISRKAIHPTVGMTPRGNRLERAENPDRSTGLRNCGEAYEREYSELGALRLCSARLLSCHRESTHPKTRSQVKLNRRQFLGGGLTGASLLLGSYGSLYHPPPGRAPQLYSSTRGSVKPDLCPTPNVLPGPPIKCQRSTTSWC